MDCKHIQKLIGAFDKNQLSLKEEELFVNHMMECKECQEELEIYYIVEYGLADDDAKLDYGIEAYKKLIESYDFKQLVDKKLKDSKQSIIKHKKTQHYIKVAFVISELCVFAAGALYIYILV